VAVLVVALFMAVRAQAEILHPHLQAKETTVEVVVALMLGGEGAVHLP
jgi:hypothetical protein